MQREKRLVEAKKKKKNQTRPTRNVNKQRFRCAHAETGSKLSWNQRRSPTRRLQKNAET